MVCDIINTKHNEFKVWNSFTVSSKSVLNISCISCVLLSVRININPVTVIEILSGFRTNQISFIEHVVNKLKTHYFCVIIKMQIVNMLILILFWYRLLTNMISLISINSHENIMVSFGLDSLNLRGQLSNVLLVYDLLKYGLTLIFHVYCDYNRNQNSFIYFGNRWSVFCFFPIIVLFMVHIFMG